MSSILIERCPVTPPDHILSHLTTLINEVYATAEAGLWKTVEGRAAPRTTRHEIASLCSKQQLLVALSNGRIVGSVNTVVLNSSLAEFGMLVADPHRRGEGIGRALVQAAETWGRQQGCTTMQLELLTPKSWTHPVKAFLHDWYIRIGYRPIKTEPFEHAYGHLAPHLATPCDFTIYHKSL